MSPVARATRERRLSSPNHRSAIDHEHESTADTHHREARPVTTSVDNLRKIPLFSRLSDGDLQSLATKMNEIIVPAGTALITEE